MRSLPSLFISILCYCHIPSLAYTRMVHSLHYLQCRLSRDISRSVFGASHSRSVESLNAWRLPIVLIINGVMSNKADRDIREKTVAGIEPWTKTSGWLRKDDDGKQTMKIRCYRYKQIWTNQKKTGYSSNCMPRHRIHEFRSRYWQGKLPNYPTWWIEIVL